MIEWLMVLKIDHGLTYIGDVVGLGPIGVGHVTLDL